MLDNLWIIPAFPLLGVVLNAFLGYRLGRRFVNIVGPGVVGLAFVAAAIAVWQLVGLPADERTVNLTLFTWIPVGDFQVNVSLLLDPLSAVMILVVTGVGFLIHVYSVGYMADDESYARYFTYLNLFMFSMLILVLGQQLPAALRGLGAGGHLLLPADRLLVHAQERCRRRQEGLHRQPHRRLRLCPGRHAHLRRLRHARLQRRSSPSAEHLLERRDL